MAPATPEEIPEELDRAWKLFEDGELEAAQKLVTAILFAGPEGDDALDAYYLRGEIQLEQEKPRQAILSYQTAAAADPGSPHACAGWGDALFQLWRFEDAQEKYALALRSDTRCARAHRGAALSLDRIGKRKLADLHFERAHDLDPEIYPLPVRVSREAFDRLAREAIESLPDEVKSRLGPIGFRVMDYPELAMLADRPDDADPETLGLFFGEDLPARFEARSEVSFVPNHIYLFQRNLEQLVVSEEELEDEVRTTVYHEVGHYLGYDEDGLDEIGLG